MAAFFNTTKPKTVIGLEISPNAIHMIEAKGKATDPQLVRTGHTHIDETIYMDGVIEDPQTLNQLLEPLLAPCYSDQVALCVEDQHVTTRTVQLENNLSDEDLEDNVGFELERSLPFPLEEAYFDFSIIGVNKEDNKLNDVIVTACRRNAIDPQLEVLNQLGYHTCLVSTASNVLSHLLNDVIQKNKNQHAGALINIEHDTIRLVVCQKERTLFSDIVSYETGAIPQCIDSLLALAQSEITDLNLQSLYITGQQPNAHDLDTLKHEITAEITLLNPLQQWQGGDIKLQHSDQFCLAAALALEGLRQ